MTPKAYSVKEFCIVYGISRNLFYSLLKDGNTPQTIKLGKRRLITVEAAENWVKQIENNPLSGAK